MKNLLQFHFESEYGFRISLQTKLLQQYICQVLHLKLVSYLSLLRIYHVCIYLFITALPKSQE